MISDLTRSPLATDWRKLHLKHSGVEGSERMRKGRGLPCASGGACILYDDDDDDDVRGILFGTLR